MRNILHLLYYFFVIIEAFGNEKTSYNRSHLMRKYPGFGSDFVFFADDHGKPIKAYFKAPKSRFLFNVDVEKDVKFTYYSRNHTNGYTLNSIKNIPNSFDKSKPTKIVTHGWMSGGHKDTCVRIKNSYLKKQDVNVFIMDWGKIADNIIYPIPMAETTKVAAYYSKFLNNLVDRHGVHPSRIHLIGHSLGAHISGFAGRGVRKGKVGRITGLDPALPGFDLGLVDGGRLSKNDSDFVDVIHTCAGFLGYKDPIGHADFYPNGGTPPQPGCSILELIEACSHGRSWKLFADSIIVNGYNATRCDSLTQMFDSTKSCDGKIIKMGEPVSKEARGIYYLKTSDKDQFIE